METNNKLQIKSSSNANGNNVCCRIFKEQIQLINQLPENERGVVLLCAINNAFFQLDNQDENQDDNQLDNQDDGHLLRYSVSVSVYNSLSSISKAVVNMLQKSVRCVEFKANWGGRRSGSGKKRSVKNEHSKNFDIFLNLVISCFEPQIETEEQKGIWVANNSDCLHDIFDYCNQDFELAIITINKCFAPLKREGMNYSYKAVVRNLSMYYSQAVEVRQGGKKITWNEEQKAILNGLKNEQ